MLQLPGTLEYEFRDEILKKEEKSMPYVTSLERFAIAKGREEGQRSAIRETIKDALLVRFGIVPEGAREYLESLTDLARLKAIQRLAITCQNIDEFTRLAPLDS